MSNNLTSSRYLGELMGAPMAAIVQAEALAAQATAEFIKGVGFEQSENESNEDKLGKLRMVTFSYSKMDMDGSLKSVDIKLPLLSIVPIPAIQVREAQLDFNLQITGTESATPSSSSSLSSASTLGTPKTVLPIGSKNTLQLVDPLKIKAIFGKKPSSTPTPDKTSYNMNVKITLEQSDIPIGLQQLFSIMEKSLVEEDTPKNQPS